MPSLSLSLSLGAQGSGSGSAPPSPDAILQESGDKLLLEAGTPVLKDTSIQAQSAAGALAGTEFVAIVQGGTTNKVSVDVLTIYLRAN